MKSIVKTLIAASLSIAAVSACSDEKLSPSTTGTRTTVHFGATSSIVDNTTKATLTSDDDNRFIGAWENGDEIGIQYTYVSLDMNETTSGTWDKSKSEFSAEIVDMSEGEEVLEMKYNASYPYSKDGYVDFGSNRTQVGASYNSKYDLMVSEPVTVTAKPGVDADGKAIVFPMQRQTAIAYFHLTSDNTEAVTKATLKVEGENAAIAAETVVLEPTGMTHENGLQEIVLTTTDQTADDFKLWFNVLPTSYTKMSLTIETATKTLTINNNTPGKYDAEHLYKVKGTLSADKWVEKTGSDIEFFYESFDKCDGDGGNDNKWSGPIASVSLADNNLDNSGWSFVSCNGANQCIKLGTGSKKGSATTPALGITATKAKLAFKAGLWNGDTGKTVNISVVGNGSVDPSSVTLDGSVWTEYECVISGADENTQIKFEADATNKNRFFLDEVCVYSGNKPVKKTAQTISFSSDKLELFIDATEFTEPVLSGVKTTATYSSSNESVAAVDATTGKLTLLSEGETTITANAEETDTYKPASASYTLKVSLRTQTLSFEKLSYSVLLKDKDTFVSPKVIGAQTDVTYSISFADGTAEDAFSIDEKTGELTINTIGQATIIATAIPSAIYKEASASYLLVVKEEAGEETKVEKSSKIVFGKNDVNISKESVTASDSEKNSWTITTVGTTSFTANNAYYQVGSSSKPATSITFTTTLPDDAEIAAIEAKFGGFNGTSGDVSLKVDETSIGNGKLNASKDVVIKSASVANGNQVSITITNITKGVKCYYIQLDYKTAK